ncbi:MAG TPA: YqgE/AlgH family protein [Asticcacaulis sp.]|nr:YqgE/AlgH family protein [Asticcacaulis sp.]
MPIPTGDGRTFQAAPDMTPQADHISYQGSLLVAMPGLNGDEFAHSVVYVCRHDENHAMGLILNQPIVGLDFGIMLKELGIGPGQPQPSASLEHKKIYRGGPVQNDRGFVLHSLDYSLDDATLPLGGPYQERDGEPEGVGLTASRDILVDLSKGEGPARTLIALGYAGWGPGQLEDEIGQNAWLVAPASQELLFDGAPETLWSRALANLGIEAGHLSGSVGTA